MPRVQRVAGCRRGLAWERNGSEKGLVSGGRSVPVVVWWSARINGPGRGGLDSCPEGSELRLGWGRAVRLASSAAVRSPEARGERGSVTNKATDSAVLCALAEPLSRARCRH